MKKTLSSIRKFALALLGMGMLQGSVAVAEIVPNANLITNGSATSPLATGWTVIANGGQGWVTTTTGGKDGVGGQFLTSHLLCSRSQTIDLLAKGATAAELDAAPPIRVEEYFQSIWLNNNAPDGYYIKVELRSATQAVIASWNVGTSTALKLLPAINVWYSESHEFRDYGPGVRYIYIEDGGRDNGNWADQYGVNMDAATVCFLNIPPTDIVASRAVYASNAPAGGLVGYLSATDVDDTMHSFALAQQVTTPTANLISAASTGWLFLDGGKVADANWATPEASEALWGVGQGPLGYDSTNADTWKKTQVSYGADAANKPMATYFRKHFTVNSPQDVVALGGTLMLDDACVIYLNGQEVFRKNFNALDTITPTTPALVAIGGADESRYDAWTVPQDKLVHLLPGDNVLAVEVHQDKVSSSDLTMDVTLNATFATTTNDFDNALFTITDNQIRLAQPASAMGAGAKTIRVQATDSGGNNIVRLITVTPLGVAFTSTPSALALNPKTFAENQPFTTPLAQFSATDADVNDALAYELVDGAGATDNALFTIHGNQLFAVEKLDFETKPALSIRVRVTDSIGLNSTATFSLTLTDDVTEDDDNDGLPESAEDLNNNGVLDPGETSPILADSDGDGYDDKIERDNGSDPRDGGSVPDVVPLRQVLTHNTNDSWLTAASWQGGVGLQPFHLAIVDNLTFRPPPTDNPIFPGKGVELRNGAVFRLKHIGLATVPDIRLDNATIQQGMTVLLSVGGPGSILQTNTLGILDSVNVPLDVQASLSGRGTFRAIGSTGGVVSFSAPAQNFTGDLVIVGPEVQLLSDTALTGARRILVNSGKLRLLAPTTLPNSMLVQKGTGVVSFSGDLSVATAVFGGTVVPAGSYSVSELAALGIPVTAMEDGGGRLTVSGTLNTVDSDGDGATDVQEALAQTDPNDRNSLLRIGTLGAEAGPSVRITWASVVGVKYRLDFADTLGGTWTPVTTITATGATSQYVDSTYPSFFPHGFYKLVIVP